MTSDFSQFRYLDDTSPVVLRKRKKARTIVDSDEEPEKTHAASPKSQYSAIDLRGDDSGWLEKRDSSSVMPGNNLIRKRAYTGRRAKSVDSLCNLSPSAVAVAHSNVSPDIFALQDTPPGHRRKAPNVSLITSKKSSADRVARYENRGQHKPSGRIRHDRGCDSDSDDSHGSNSSGGSSDVNEWDDDVDNIAKVKEKVKHILDHCGHLSSKLRTTMMKWQGDSNQVESDCINLTAISSPAPGGETDDGSSSLLQKEDFEECCPGLVLKDYQTVGVNWMRLLHENKVNGVLADDMGLGKTIQTIAFLSWLKARNELSGKHQTHLVVVPASTLDNWLNEFYKFGPLLVIEEYHGPQAERVQMQRSILRGIENQEIDVIICTYTMFERESGKNDRSFLKRVLFSYLVLDEAHCIKNANSSRFESLGKLHCKHRLLLSGTPVQNDIKELLNLLSFLTPKVFRSRDVQTLLLGISIDEKQGFRGTGKELIPIRHIRTMMSPFVMRRMKVDVLGQLPKKTIVEKLLSMSSVQQKVYENIIKSQLRRKALAEPIKAENIPAIDDIVDLSGDATLMSADEKAKQTAKNRKKLKAEKELMELMACTGPKSNRGAKNKAARAGDVVVPNLFEVVNLVDDESDKNLTSYDTNNDIDALLEKMKTSDINHLFTALRKAANHPLMLRVHFTDAKVVDLIARVALGSGHYGEQADYAKVRAEIESYSDFDINRLCLEYPSSLGHLQLPASVLYDSTKMQFLREKLPELIADGHRVLIFSQWTRILDLLEVLLEDISMSFLRLDGSTAVSTRQNLINTFNDDNSIPVFLLSTKAGGLGVNLTAADTVILHDLDMNPENDRQAEDRSHRIGQTRSVTVYKLVVRETVDEGILDIGRRKTELINSVLVSDMAGSMKAAAAEDKALIAALLQKAMGTAHMSLERTMKQ